MGSTKRTIHFKMSHLNSWEEEGGCFITRGDLGSYKKKSFVYTYFHFPLTCNR